MAKPVVAGRASGPEGVGGLNGLNPNLLPSSFALIKKRRQGEIVLTNTRKASGARRLNVQVEQQPQSQKGTGENEPLADAGDNPPLLQLIHRPGYAPCVLSPSM